MTQQPTFGQRNLVIENRDWMPHGLILWLEENLNGNIEADYFNLQWPMSFLSNASVECGNGGSHIWIADRHTRQRVAIIYYENILK